MNIKTTVMIIDDDKLFLAEIAEMLNLNGYITSSFESGVKALNAIEKIKPDIILLDLKLKEKSGFQIAEEITGKQETRNIPIIAMTAFFTEREHFELMEFCGIKAVIIKPFSTYNIIAKIESLLNCKKAGSTIGK